MTNIQAWDEYLPAVPLHLCPHGDAPECDLCLYEVDHDCDFDDETIQVARVAHA